MVLLVPHKHPGMGEFGISQAFSNPTRLIAQSSPDYRQNTLLLFPILEQKPCLQ